MIDEWYLDFNPTLSHTNWDEEHQEEAADQCHYEMLIRHVRTYGVEEGEVMPHWASVRDCGDVVRSLEDYMISSASGLCQFVIPGLFLITITISMDKLIIF